MLYLRRDIISTGGGVSETKPCEICGSTIEKPASCSRANWPKRRFCSMDCKAASQVGKPSGSKGKPSPRKGLTHPIPCRICGQPTRYNAKSLIGRISCTDPACRTASVAIRGKNLSEGMKARYASGERRKLRDTWSKVSRISREETLLAPALAQLGFTPQYRVLTGTTPATYYLDFADVSKRIDIEIDGSSHRSCARVERDRRRDEILGRLGWTVIRITAAEVSQDPDAAILKAATLIS